MKLWFIKGGWASKKGRKKAERLRPETVKKIAVIRHAALGDMVLTRPFLIELRKHFPQAEITLSLVSNYTRGAPEDLVDHVHVVSGSDRRDTSFMEQIRSARELGEQDIIFDQAATTRSYWVCKLNRAKLKVGFPFVWYRNPLFYDVSVLRSDLKFEAEVLLDMLSLLGYRTKYPLEFALPHSKTDDAGKFIAYFPGASIDDKRWPQERFTDLIKRMASEYPDIPHKVLEGVGPHESIDEIMASLDNYENVEASRIRSLDETTDFIGSAAMLVSNDTGIRNLSIAAGTPTVGIFFSTPVFRYWPRDGFHEVAFNADGSLPAVDDVFKRSRDHFIKVLDLKRRLA